MNPDMSDFVGRSKFTPHRVWNRGINPRTRNVSTSLRMQMLAKSNFDCTYCGKTRDLQPDHILPWSKGGLTVIENLQTLCRWCNQKKGSR